MQRAAIQRSFVLDADSEIGARDASPNDSIDPSSIEVGKQRLPASDESFNHRSMMSRTIGARCAIKQFTDDGQWNEDCLLCIVQFRRILAIEPDVVDDCVRVESQAFDHFLTGSVGKASSMIRANSSPSSSESNPRRSLHGGLTLARSATAETFSGRSRLGTAS